MRQQEYIIGNRAYIVDFDLVESEYSEPFSEHIQEGGELVERVFMDYIISDVIFKSIGVCHIRDKKYIDKPLDYFKEEEIDRLKMLVIANNSIMDI